MQVLRQFRVRPLQSFLIVLAIALGVAVITAVTAFLDIGTASSRDFAASVAGRRITLTPKASDWQAFYEGPVPIPVVKLGAADDEPIVFTLDDVERARAAAPAVDYAYTEVAQFMSVATVDMAFVDAVGITPDYLEANEIKLSSGNGFIGDDYEQKKPLALVSSRLIKAADITGDPIGRGIEGYEIVGVLEEPENPDADQPNMLIPFPADPFNPIDSLSFVVKDHAKLEAAREQLETYARKTWGERVSVRVASDSSLAVQTRAAQFIVAVLASVGLVVAGFNVMNLMLARVLGQVKRIGILRSVGASRSRIRRTYLADSVALGFVGGVAGVGLAYALLVAFNRYLQLANPDFAKSLFVHLSLPAAAIGLGVACLLSALCAWYPALLASRTDIVTSLKEP